MKITTFILIFFYVIFLLNGVSILCDTINTPNGKKKKKKKKAAALSKQVVKRSPSNQNQDIYLVDAGEKDQFTEEQIKEAREVLSRVMEADEVKRVAEKKKKKKAIVITVTSVIGAIILGALIGTGSFFFHKYRKGAGDPKPLPEPQKPKPGRGPEDKPVWGDPNKVYPPGYPVMPSKTLGKSTMIRSS